MSLGCYCWVFLPNKKPIYSRTVIWKKMKRSHLRKAPNTFPNNAQMNNHTNLNLGRIVYTMITLFTPASSLSLLNGYDFFLFFLMAWHRKPAISIFWEVRWVLATFNDAVFHNLALDISFDALTAIGLSLKNTSITSSSIQERGTTSSLVQPIHMG